MSKKYISAILFAFFILISISPSVLAEDEANVIIGYENETVKQQIIDLSNTVEYEFDSLQSVSVSMDQQKIETLKDNPNIEYIEENSKVQLADNGLITELPELDATPETERWNIHFTGVTKAWEEGYTGRNVNIAVIDTGISSHSELNIKGGVSTVEYTDDWTDDHGHGTHVAGTINAIKNNQGVVGVAPGANIFAVKALDDNGDGHLADVIAGIYWAVENNIDIINLSLGTKEENQPFKEAIDYAYNQGVLIIAASGNDGQGMAVTYPAKYENVIAVSAVNARMEVAGFSSTGAEVEFSAPGVGIVSTFLNGSYGFANGTSQASPHVTGMLAILKQKYPGMNNSELRTALTEHVNDLGDPGRDPLFGYGFIRYHALDTTPPDEVKNIKVIEQTDHSVTLEWDMPEDEDLNQVDIYLNDVFHGTVLQSEVPMYTIDNLEAAKKYYVTFYSEDLSGNYSSGKNYRIKTLDAKKEEVEEEGNSEDVTEDGTSKNHVVPEKKEIKNTEISQEQQKPEQTESNQEKDAAEVEDEEDSKDEKVSEQDESETADAEEKDSEAKSSKDDKDIAENKEQQDNDNNDEEEDSNEEEKGFFQKIVDFFIRLFEAIIDWFR